MNRSITLLLLAAALGLPAGPARAEEPRRLTILYTGSLRGNLDGCACERGAAAGLVKRAAWLKSDRPQGPSLLVDAGDILDETPDADLSRQILEVYGELRYDAVAVGEQELVEGMEALSGYRRRFPFLQAGNLPIPRAPGRGAATPEPRIVARGGVRVAVVALADPSLFDPSVGAAPAAPAARELVRRGREARADLVLLLWHGSRDSLAALLAEVGGVDVAVYGHEGRLEPPTRVGGTLVASPGAEGDHIGILTLTLSGGKVASFEGQVRTFTFRGDPDDAGVRRRADRWREDLRRRLGVR